MKNKFTIHTCILFLLFVINSICGNTKVHELNLMPMPRSIILEDGKFYLNDDLVININKDDSRLFKSSVRALNVLTERSGLFLENQFPVINKETSAGGVFIEISNKSGLDFGIDESYTLDVTSQAIVIKADNSYGAMHGLSTLLQLLNSDEQGYYFPCVKIADTPRFPWRGLLIDVSRHFLPVEVIKRNLDAMAAVKLNVLHWHLTDDQGFRIESKVFPKLHELGSDGIYYTQSEIRDIVQYASERGIRVVPEFDLPGHATSWFVGYPELASAPGPYTIERLWGIFNPTFNPANEEVYRFLSLFFKEMSELFPDRYWHIGGDENKGKQWAANPEIQKFMQDNDLTDNHALQNYFNERLGEILSKLNKTMIGWYTDEMPDLSKDYIVQAWKGRSTLYKTAERGYRSLLSHGFYIDLVQTTEFHYLNDPIPSDSILTDEVKERIIGGEATMWAEFVGPETVDSRIWPRSAAIAERLWSPGEINDVLNMYDRLDNVSIQLETFGLTHIKNSDVMLRRIVGGYNIDPLKTFVEVIQPLYTYSRDRPHVFRSYYPLTRVVDAAKPDPREARIFDKIVEDFVSSDSFDSRKYEDIKNSLLTWKGNHTKLVPLIRTKPILKEIELLSEDLSKVAQVGLEALELYVNQKKADEIWLTKCLGILDSAARPRGETELAVISPIRKILTEVQ